MNLEANASRAIGREGQRGYAMAALLVAMAVMAILMTAAMPTWKQMATREKEEELIFRGTQWARAIGAYQRKFANASPPNADVLIEQHFLRKKYKDPMAVTEDGEFAMLYVATGLGGGNPGTSGQGTSGRGTTQGTQGAGTGSAMQVSTTPSGNIIGVVSKNPAASLRTYKDQTHYNEWQFMALQQSTRAGGAGGAGGQGRGGIDLGGGATFTPAGGRTGGNPQGPGGPGGRGRGGPGGAGGPGGRGFQVGPDGTVTPRNGGAGAGGQGGGPQVVPQGGGGRGR
jgi:type II secretory pathway pseudopilin PulG